MNEHTRNPESGSQPETNQPPTVDVGPVSTVGNGGAELQPASADSSPGTARPQDPAGPSRGAGAASNPHSSNALSLDAAPVLQPQTPGQAVATGAGGSEQAAGGETMADIYEESMRHIREGEIIRGTIMQIDKDMVLVDIGFKSEGLIPIEEFPNHGRYLSVGEEVDVYLEATEDSEGQVVLSKEKANKIKIWETLTTAFDQNQDVEGTVVARIKGGLTVDVGLKAFLPGSQVDLRPVRNLDKMIGEKLRMKIIKLNRKRGNIVLSRRVLLEEERQIAKTETLKKLTPGAVMDGQVKNLTDYGAFVDLGGIDGLLHITDMSWGRVSHPSELVNVGDRLKVMVLNFDPKTERVSLGHKQLMPDPWTNVAQKFPEGTRLRGKVVSIANYGAFIEIEPGVEGLVHMSEMSWTKRVRHPSKIVNIGDNVECQVLRVEPEKKRISLGMKQVEPNPWDTVEVKYPVGSLVEGKVRNLTDFGAFLALEEGIDGLIHISDMSWTQRVKHPSEILKKGQRVQAQVLSVDKESERLSLGLKQLDPDPWDQVASHYVVGQTVDGEVAKITKFGAFVTLRDGIEGLVHVSEMSRTKVANPEDVLAVGDRVKAKIIKLDAENKKIALSIRAYMEDEEIVDLSEVLSRPEAEPTIGDVLDKENREALADLAQRTAASAEQAAPASPGGEETAAAEVSEESEAKPEEER
ncbi:MAG: 30S ribosomal protein S1 [Candidatus Tectomicrobia bacterium]|nr:30S ribosomal protein S1 [Candidatus Tectomicrobia bacterium]